MLESVLAGLKQNRLSFFPRSGPNQSINQSINSFIGEILALLLIGDTMKCISQNLLQIVPRFTSTRRSKSTKRAFTIVSDPDERPAWQSGMGRLTTIHLSLLFSSFSNVYHFACVWPTALKLGCITNFDMLFLVMVLISLVDEIQFMLISSRHICIR